MSDSRSKRSHLTHKEKKALAAQAARKARFQWYLIAAALAAAFVIAVILISIFTDGNLPTQGGSQG